MHLSDERAEIEIGIKPLDEIERTDTADEPDKDRRRLGERP